MKDLRCIFGLHYWSDWARVAPSLYRQLRRCMRCPATQDRWHR